VIYTAGTDHAKVELEGLEHERALRIRAHLLPSGAGDAV
jgi:membrane protein YdbS with pleckstrin-like domain